MSLRKNISGGERDVPLLNRVVADGETVEVPDFQPGSTDENPLPIVWPETVWEAVDAPQAEPEPAFGTETVPAASDIIGEGM